MARPRGSGPRGGGCSSSVPMGDGEGRPGPAEAPGGSAAARGSIGKWGRAAGWGGRAEGGGAGRGGTAGAAGHAPSAARPPGQWEEALGAAWPMAWREGRGRIWKRPGGTSGDGSARRGAAVPPSPCPHVVVSGRATSCRPKAQPGPPAAQTLAAPPRGLRPRRRAGSGQQGCDGQTATR